MAEKGKEKKYHACDELSRRSISAIKREGHAGRKV